MCVIQHNREGVFRELYQIENTLIRFISGIFALLERFSQTSQGYSLVRDVSTGSRYSNRSRTSASTLWRRCVLLIFFDRRKDESTTAASVSAFWFRFHNREKHSATDRARFVDFHVGLFHFAGAIFKFNDHIFNFPCG